MIIIIQVKLLCPLQMLQVLLIELNLGKWKRFIGNPLEMDKMLLEGPLLS
jgi:hypothetical protein